MLGSIVRTFSLIWWWGFTEKQALICGNVINRHSLMEICHCIGENFQFSNLQIS